MKIFEVTKDGNCNGIILEGKWELYGIRYTRENATMKATKD